MLNCLLRDSSCFIFVKQHFLPVSYARWSTRHLLYNNIEVFFYVLENSVSVNTVQYFFFLQHSTDYVKNSFRMNL
jgi:hypothetical protein